MERLLLFIFGDLVAIAFVIAMVFVVTTIAKRRYESKRTHDPASRIERSCRTCRCCGTSEKSSRLDIPRTPFLR